MRKKSSNTAGSELGAAISTSRGSIQRRNPGDGAGDRIDRNRAAEGVADDRRERPEPLAGHAHGLNCHRPASGGGPDDWPWPGRSSETTRKPAFA